jgi:HAD superfamily hydrolase (TIGR01509 family)
MSGIELVIFDCDGVLVDSEFLAARHESRAYAEFGFDLPVAKFSERFSGMTGEAILAEVERELGVTLPEGLHAKIDEGLRKLIDAELSVIAGAADAVDRIELPKCICSNSREDRLASMLRSTGLYDRFAPHIFSARTHTPHAPKPKPDIFLHALKHFGLQGRQAVVIEDSAHGVHAAVAAGARVIGFTGGGHTFPGHADQLTDAGAETVISSHRLLPATVAAFAQWDGIA